LRLANILAVFALAILAVSLVSPWIVLRAPFIGEYDKTLLDIIIVMFRRGSGGGGSDTSPKPPEAVLLALILTIVFFIASAALSLMALRKNRFAVYAGITGILDFITWLAFYYMLEDFIANSNEAPISQDLIRGFIDIGIGAYLILIYSALSISTYIAATKKITVEDRMVGDEEL